MQPRIEWSELSVVFFRVVDVHHFGKKQLCLISRLWTVEAVRWRELGSFPSSSNRKCV